MFSWKAKGKKVALQKFPVFAFTLESVSVDNEYNSLLISSRFLRLSCKRILRNQIENVASDPLKIWLSPLRLFDENSPLKTTWACEAAKNRCAQSANSLSTLTFSIYLQRTAILNFLTFSCCFCSLRKKVDSSSVLNFQFPFNDICCGLS